MQSNIACLADQFLCSLVSITNLTSSGLLQGVEPSTMMLYAETSTNVTCYLATISTRNVDTMIFKDNPSTDPLLYYTFGPFRNSLSWFHRTYTPYSLNLFERKPWQRYFLSVKSEADVPNKSSVPLDCFVTTNWFRQPLPPTIHARNY